MSSLVKTLIELGYQPNALPQPGGNYLSVRRTEHLAYVAIQYPIIQGEFKYQGRLGLELTVEAGYQTARMAALNALFQLEHYIGLDHLASVNHMDFYYQADESWDEAPIVANGASDVLVEVLGERGKHSRAIVGAYRLPRNFSVGLTLVCGLLPVSD